MGKKYIWIGLFLVILTVTLYFSKSILIYFWNPTTELLQKEQQLRETLNVYFSSTTDIHFADKELIKELWKSKKVPYYQFYDKTNKSYQLYNCYGKVEDYSNYIQNNEIDSLKPFMIDTFNCNNCNKLISQMSKEKNKLLICFVTKPNSEVLLGEIKKIKSFFENENIENFELILVNIDFIEGKWEEDEIKELVKTYL